MRKEIATWTVLELAEWHKLIHFPEYQREANLWALHQKQRLIDSMVREFDIASLYLYDYEDDRLDCVDGRQRIGAIMSFCGENPSDSDNNFVFRIRNEIREEAAPEFSSLDGRTYRGIEAEIHVDEACRRFVERLQQYKIVIVRLSASEAPEEFNLQFTRLNLGKMINSGEMLNAMVGDLRDRCFGQTGLGNHGFLRSSGIPIRRFAHEQLAGQIVAQIFSVEDEGEYTRTRHCDLQRLFKQYSMLGETHRVYVERLALLLDLLEQAVCAPLELRSRAMIVTIVAFAWQKSVSEADEARELAKFIGEFVLRLRWQVQNGVAAYEAYYYLLEFQRQITQASVEKPAVTSRIATLDVQYCVWRDTGLIGGDREWSEAHEGASAREAALASVGRLRGSK